MPGKTWVSGPVLDLTLHGVGPGAPSFGAIGIVDTGASVICLDKRIAVQLGLSAVNKKMMQMADGTEVLATGYMAKLTVPDLGFHDLVQVFGVSMQYPSNRVLLGRSFLRGYIVNYNGPTERFEFHEVADSIPYEEHDG